MSNIYDVKVKSGKPIPWKALFLNSYAVTSLNNIKLDYVDSSGGSSVTYHLLTNDEFKRTMIAKYSTVAWPIWIMNTSGEWEDQYLDPDNIQKMMGLTTSVASTINTYLTDHKTAFWHVYKATVLASYDPLANYDRKETRTLTKDGTETLTKEGTETLTRGGSETHTNSVDANDPVTSKGYNTQMDVVTESEVNKSVSTGTTTDTLTLTNRTDSTSFNGRKDVTSFGDRVDTEEIRAFGNIGVTTSQQMAEAAIDLGAKEAFVNWVVGQVVQDLFVYK